MRVMILVIAGPEDDPILAFNKSMMVYANSDAADTTSHLLDLAAAAKQGIEEAAEAIAEQVDRLAPQQGRHGS